MKSKLPRLLITETSATAANAVTKLLEGSADVEHVATIDASLSRLREHPPQVLMASVSPQFDGEKLVERAHKIAPLTAVILLYGVESSTVAARRAAHAGADAFWVAPLNKNVVLSTLRLVMKLRAARLRARHLSRPRKSEKGQPMGAALAQPIGSRPADVAFLRKYLLREISRSRRYHLPVSVLLISTASTNDDERSEALHAASRLLRDIDLLLPFAKDRMLALLPHTGASGALKVASKLLARHQKAAASSWSIGLASYEPDAGPRKPASYGALLRQASIALKRAAQAGGNRVEIATAND